MWSCVNISNLKKDYSITTNDSNNGDFKIYIHPIVYFTTGCCEYSISVEIYRKDGTLVKKKLFSDEIVFKKSISKILEELLEFISKSL